MRLGIKYFGSEIHDGYCYQQVEMRLNDIGDFFLKCEVQPRCQ